MTLAELGCFLAGAMLGIVGAWCLLVTFNRWRDEARPLPVHRPHLRLVTGEELERRAAEARS